MPNTHLVPDMLKEVQSIAADLLPATIISTSWPTVPVPPSLTLAAFATTGYVRDGTDLVYVRQAAQPVTLTGADGNYWLAVTVDTWTDYAQWTRQYGTHYAWRPNSTQPADVDGLLVIVQLTVAGGAITAVTPITSRATLAAAWRGLLALGTLATQNANAVAITGGQAQVARLGVGSAPPGTDNYTQLNGPVGVQQAPAANVGLGHTFNKATQFGMVVHQVGADTGQLTVAFTNVAGTVVGSIDTTASATAFNTSSDARLKHAVQPLTGSLDLLRRLNPISHRWNADDSYAENFLAHELQQVLPYAVTGEPDAVHDDGSVRPQQVDASKIIPRLVGAVQELLAQVDALTTRVTELETALGL